MNWFYFEPTVNDNSIVYIFAKVSAMKTDRSIALAVNTSEYIQTPEFIAIPTNFVKQNAAATNLAFAFPILTLKPTSMLPQEVYLEILFYTNSTTTAYEGFELTHKIEIRDNCGFAIIKPCVDDTGRPTSLPPNDPYYISLNAVFTNSNKSLNQIAVVMQPNFLSDSKWMVEDTYDLFVNGTDKTVFTQDDKSFVPDRLTYNSQTCLAKMASLDDKPASAKVSIIAVQFSLENLNVAALVRRRRQLNTAQLIQTCNGIRLVVYDTSPNEGLVCKTRLDRANCDTQLTAFQWAFIAISFIGILAVALSCLALIIFTSRSRSKMRIRRRNEDEEPGMYRLKSRSEANIHERSKSSQNLWYLQDDKSEGRISRSQSKNVFHSNDALSPRK